MQTWFENWWPTIKAVLAIVILVAIGRRFWHDLHNPDLWQRPLGAGWLTLSGLLYITGLGMSAWYWHRLLRVFGQKPDAVTSLRAYYLGHMGKYAPGKAWALILRATLSIGPGVRVGVAGLTAFYEVLTTMASGVLLAVIVLALLAPDADVAFDWTILLQLLRLETPEVALLDRKLLVALALLLLVPLALPILPGFFNRVVGKVAARFGDRDTPPMARVPATALVEGLLLTAFCWLMWGLSLWAMFQALCKQPPAWDTAVWLRWTGLMGIAYVAGFVILLVPGGLGVREFFLTLFLVPELAGLQTGESDPRAAVILGVVLLRLVWTVAEVAAAALVYFLPTPSSNPDLRT